MKQSFALAGLVAGLAAASQHNHGHNHAHARRGDNGAVTSWDITTEWTYVTVTGAAGADHTEQAQAPASQQAPSASAPASAQVTAQAAAPSSSSDDVQAAAYDPVAAQNSAIASQNAAISSQNAVNSAMVASNNAHQASMLGGSTVAAQPTHATSVAQVSSAATSAQAPTKASSSAAAPASTGCVETFMTYYSGAGAYGSCGDPVIDSNNTVAMGQQDMNGKCFDKIKIYVNGQSEGHEAMVTDKCAACASDGHVDIAQDWAFQIAGQAALVAAGKLPIKYCWM